MKSIKIFFNLLGIALKNLWRRKVRTTLTVIAVSIGTIAVISLVSIATGAKNVFLSQFRKTGALSQVTVIASSEVESLNLFGGGGDEGEGEKMTDETVEEILSVDHVVAVSPQLHLWPLRSISLEKTDKRYSLDITAVRPNAAIEVALAAGRFVEKEEKNAVVLSYKLAEAFNGSSNNLGSLVGQQVTLRLEKGHFTTSMDLPEEQLHEYFSKREKLYHQDRDEEAESLANPLEEIVNTVDAEIVGITTPGPQEHNNYISLDWGKEFLTRKNVHDLERDEEGQPTGKLEYDIWNDFTDRGYDTLVAKIDNVDNVEPVAQVIEDHYNRGTITAKDFLDAFLRVFLVVQIALGGIGGIALFVAAIGIINTMLMAVLERTHEIGLLKAVGATGGMVGWIFTLEAGLIGLLGGFCGVGGGIGIAQIVNRIASNQLAAQNFTVENIITFPLWLVGGGLAFSFVLGTLAGLIPSLRAARLDPIDALRAE